MEAGGLKLPLSVLHLEYILRLRPLPLFLVFLQPGSSFFPFLPSPTGSLAFGLPVLARPKWS